MSEGLPGKLTIANIEGARAAGRNYIIYHHKTYTLEELEDGAGISRTKSKPKISPDVHSERTNRSDGEVTEPSSNSRKKQS